MWYFLNLKTGELRAVQNARLTGEVRENPPIKAIDMRPVRFGQGPARKTEIPAPPTEYVELECPFCRAHRGVRFMGCACGALPVKIVGSGHRFAVGYLHPDDLRRVIDVIGE